MTRYGHVGHGDVGHGDTEVRREVLYFLLLRVSVPPWRVSPWLVSPWRTRP